MNAFVARKEIRATYVELVCFLFILRENEKFAVTLTKLIKIHYGCAIRYIYAVYARYV